MMVQGDLAKDRKGVVGIVSQVSGKGKGEGEGEGRGGWGKCLIFLIYMYFLCAHILYL